MVVADADIGAPAHEERRRLDPAKTGGEVERRPPASVAGIDLRAAAKEERRCGFGPEGRRGVQRCLTGRVAHPDVRAAGEQEFGDARSGVRVPRPEQRRRVVASLGR